jgi:SSS family solute:Na+ symporter
MAFASGIVNFGIFPGVNARFFIYFCGLPETVNLLGLDVSTFPLVMLASLSISLFCTFTGGQIAVITTDFIQGIFSMTVILVTCTFLLVMLGWDRIVDALNTAPPNQSWLNPFEISETKGYNISFYLIQYFLWVYWWKAWQGTQGYYSSARTPHEARMAQVWGTWRYFAQEMMVPIFAVSAIAVFHHQDFAALVAPAKQTLDGLTDEMVRSQLTVPLALSKILPIGLMGALTALMMAAALGCEQAYLHSWGSIFVQDVFLPLYKKKLSPQAHLWMLRGAILGVAVFIFTFSLLFKQTEYIRIYFSVTGAIYLGGAGACIAGGLYWKYGKTPAAWCALILGAAVAVGGLFVRQIALAKPEIGGTMASCQACLYQNDLLKNAIERIGAYDGQWMSFFAGLVAISTYIIISLLSPGGTYNLDKLLHRGKYAVADDVVEGEAEGKGLLRLLGIGPEFSRWDRRLYLSSIGWILLWGGIFVVGTAWHLLFGISTNTWTSFWHFMVWMAIVLAAVVVSTLFVGGIINLREMFELLRTRVRDHTDDGTVRASDAHPTE